MSQPRPIFTTESELDRRFGVAKLLSSGGDYGCGCVVFEGDLEDDAGDLFDDAWFYALNAQHPNDVGTVLVTGSVRSARSLAISDRLMCLVVLGDLEAPALRVFETETYIGGDLTVAEFADDDRHVTVKGSRPPPRPR